MFDHTDYERAVTRCVTAIRRLRAIQTEINMLETKLSQRREVAAIAQNELNNAQDNLDAVVITTWRNAGLNI